MLRTPSGLVWLTSHSLTSDTFDHENKKSRLKDCWQASMCHARAQKTGDLGVELLEIKKIGKDPG